MKITNFKDAHKLPPRLGGLLKCFTSPPSPLCV